MSGIVIPFGLYQRLTIHEKSAINQEKAREK